MSKYAGRNCQDQDDMEDIPNEFEATTSGSKSQYETDKFHQYSTISKHLQHGFNRLEKPNTEGSFLEKSQKFIANRLKKISDLQEEQQDKILNDCTFQPHVNKSHSKSARNIKQFLHSQQQHIHRTQDKKEELKKRIEEEDLRNMTFSPRINRKKNERNKENVHQRLYKLKDKEKDSDFHMKEQFRHIPKITQKGENLVRNAPVGELLYMDALRRAEKSQEVPEREEWQGQKNQLQEKYSAQKLLKDFKNALDATELREKTIYNEEELATILIELGYAHECPEQSSHEQELLHDCYLYLQEPGVTQINVYVFLMALRGIYNVDLNNEELTSVLVINDIEGRKLHQYFDALYRNRLYIDLAKKPLPEIRQDTSFKPSINRGSEEMASKYRCKMIERTNSIFSENKIDIKVPEIGLSHEDLLVIHSLGQNLEKEKARKFKHLEKDPQCTFQPNADKYPHELISHQIGQDKCKLLYKAARMRQEQISQLPTFGSVSNPIDQNPNPKDHIPPSPKNTNSRIKSKVKSYLEIKDVDKALSRMVVGRQQRNSKRELEERGEKSVKKQMNKSATKGHDAVRSRQILLEADIVVNNKKKKIYIYNDDEDRIDQVVDAFSKQCELDEANRQMLYTRLCKAVQNLKNN